MQQRIAGFAAVAEGKTEGLDVFLRQGKIEFLLEFMCMVKFGKEQKLMMQHLSQFADYYVTLLNYQEPQSQTEKNVLVNFRKYFVTSIKNVPQIERKSE